MSHAFRCFVVVFLLGISGSPVRTDEPKKEAAPENKLLGTWKMASAKYGDREVNPADLGTTLAITAERAFSRALGGSCHTPLAAYAEWEEGTLWLRGLIAGRDGKDILRGDVEAEVGESDAAAELGQELADDFLARGAARFLTT